MPACVQMNDWVNVCFDVTVHWSICYVWLCSHLMALKFVRLCYITLIFICDCTCECDSILKSHHMLYYTTCRSALHLHHVISHEEWCESGPCFWALYSTVPYVLTIRAVRCVLTVRIVSTYGTVLYKARKHGPDSHHSSCDIAWYKYNALLHVV